ncbi:uncharacterized protein LOC132041085 [Lycium ferocissimum]|uniref:uncharacterized protein LOC132041085 n=1 Tax=Lycium ferocissimum TaxID=112874 RepID=UPI00281628E6|nr:uncharacterized protein LOC132041085 [Lycium ferocissimum]
MIALSNSLLLPTTPSLHFSSGSSLKSANKSVSGTTKLAFSPKRGGKSSSYRRSLTVQAGYNDVGRPSSSSIFVGGFLLGGVIVGALGCIFAPEISKALAETDKKDLMRKLPKFIYDEEKALEKQRKILTEKIVQLNDAIDDISNQLRSGDEDAQNGVAVNLDEVETVS